MASDNNFSWTNEEIIQNANTLAGDVALLNRLRNISDLLLSETAATSLNVDKLLNQLDTVNLKLDLTKNEFQSLRNTQFVENRVYEDDEIVESVKTNLDNKEPIKENDEDDAVIKDAILEGLNTINKYFEKVEVTVSDSEDDEAEKSYVLQPKDMYAERPLPYLIGTKQWYKKWHVGLSQDSDSESEKEEEVDSYSDGVSEDDLPKDRWLETGAPVAHSTFNDSPETRDISQSSGDTSRQDSSISSKVPMSNEMFAEQLAAKLDSISSNAINSNINTNPIMASKQTGQYGNLFSDEPPPLNDNDNTIRPKIVTDNSDLEANSENRSILFDGIRTDYENNNLLANENKSKDSHIKVNKPKLNLFDESSSSEEDISSIVDKRKVTSVKPYLQSQRATMPLIDDKPPELFMNPADETLKKKKPVGGVSVFGSNPGIISQADVSKTLKKTLFDESSDEDSPIKNTPNNLPTPTKKEDAKPNKKISLFDEDNDYDDLLLPPKVDNLASNKKISLFDDDSYKNTGINQKNSSDSSITTAKKFSLFDDDDDDDMFGSEILNKKPPIFEKANQNGANQPMHEDKSEKKHTTSERSRKKIVSLFDDSDSSESSSELYKKNIKKEEIHSTQISPVSEINDEEKEKATGEIKLDLHKDEVQQTTDIKEETVSKETPREHFGNNAAVKTQKNISLFDSDSDSLDDDILNSKSNKSNNTNYSQKYISVTPDSEELFPFSDNISNFDKPSNSIDVPINKDNEIKSSEREQTDDSITNNSLDSDKKLDNTLPAHKPDIKQNDENSTKEKSGESKIEKYADPPVVSLFDSTPPPDTEWDNRSDNSGESDTFSINEALLDHMNSSVSRQRSNLFDEPPSLDIDVNYSSGIVKDLNNTRVDTDDSSFYPYASSSRRLSSDVFNEQQSQDSFFVTKNNTDNIQQVSNLGSIFENAENESSKIDHFTPSGTTREFDSGSVFEKNQNTSSESMEDIKIIRSMKISIDQTGSTERNIIKTVESEPESNVSSPKRASPGKLKHNLNINVAALMPGTSRPKLYRPPAPSDETDKVAEPIKLDVNNKQNCDNDIDTPGVLTSVTKNRARIPVKRRPSTRRARQEAVRKSMAEHDDLTIPDETSEYLSQPKETIVVSSGFSDEKYQQQQQNSARTAIQKSINIRDELLNTNIDTSNSSQDILQNLSHVPIDAQPSIIDSLNSLEKSNIVEVTGISEVSKANMINQPILSSTEDVHPTQLGSSRTLDFQNKTDTFGEKSLLKPDTRELEENKDTAKNDKPDIFDKDDSSSDDDFFTTVSRSIKTVLPKIKKPSLFSDPSGSDSDSELFGGKPSTLSDEKQKPQTETVQKQSLFDSDDGQSDNDLFGTKSHKNTIGTKNKLDTTVSTSVKSQYGKTHIRKLENKEVTDFDPLSGFK